MSKVASITCAAVLAAACFSASAAYAGDAMVCTDSSNGAIYFAWKEGGRIKLKAADWSANLTVVNYVGRTYITKTNKSGVFTHVRFGDDIDFFKGEAAFPYRKDNCRAVIRPEQRATSVQPQANSVLDGIKAKCAGEWPGNYRMQKYCIDTQVEAYNALQSY